MRMALLISRHRDGSYLAELSERWGYRVVRGSSQRGGDVGLLGLVRHLRQGGEVALTPDGPRGPAERMKPGALAAAQHANALVIAAGARTSSAWWIRSWDQFCLPRPFAAVEIVYSPPFAVEQGKAALRQALTRAEEELKRVTYGDGRRGTGERGSRGAVAVGDVGGGSRDAPAARSPGRPVLGRHADTERAQRRRRRVASVPPDDRGREPVGRGHWEDAARRLDRRVLRAPGMETGDSAAWLRRRRAA